VAGNRYGINKEQDPKRVIELAEELRNALDHQLLGTARKAKVSTAES
jgi:hypothetical protein